MTDFIWQMEDSLSGEFCDNMIKKFDQDKRQYDGMVGEERVDRTIKTTKDLLLTGLPDWKEEDQVLFNALQVGIEKYFNEVLKVSKDYINLHWFPDRYDCNDTGYQIQRYEPGGFYNWHHDFRIDSKYESRQFTYIWYLNTIKDGTGYTEFCDGTRIQPKKGKLAIFPSGWQYLHRAFPSKKKLKYICTGWIYSKSRKEDS